MLTNIEKKIVTWKPLLFKQHFQKYHFKNSNNISRKIPCRLENSSLFKEHMCF